MPWSMSAAEATPSSSMRMASSPRQTPRRLVAKPGESRTSMLSLSRRATQRRASATASGLVPGPTTSSTRADSGTGLKKCMPRKRSGRDSASARPVIDSELVLLASSAPGGVTFSAAASRSRLAAGISGIASTTSSTSSGPSSPMTARSRARRASTSAGSTPLRRARPSAMRASARSAAPASASTTVTSQPASSSTWAMPAPMVPPPITAARPAAPSAMGPRLSPGRRPPANGQQDRRPTAAGDETDQESGRRRRVEDPGGVVQRPLPRPEPGHGQAGHRQGHHVLVALARAEDEEPVPQVVGDPGHQHGADDAGAGHRREEAGHQQDARPDLGQAGQPGVDHAGLHPQALEPPGGAGDLPAPEDVVDPVGQEDDTERQPEEEQREVGGGGVGHGAHLVRGTRRPVRSISEDTPGPRGAPGERALQRLAAHLDSPMVIVTAAAPDGRRSGCLVGFFTQCSIHPPRLLPCISKANHTFEVARAAPVLAVH